MSEIDLGIAGLADIETIGRGGSAAVYRARQIALDRVVAVKVLMSAWDVDVRRRFDRECRSMGKLSDDLGVVPIYESGETSTGAPYIVMPYYPAGSLQDEMNRNGAFRWREASEHIQAVAETIAAANESGVIHRDIKPANLLVGNDGKPRVSDFGIARHIADEQLANHASTPLFTPAYSAPESFSENTATPTIDVYGLGSTFWALLSGHAPFKSKGEKVDMITVFSRVANDPVGDLRHLVPDSICTLIERAMAKTPAERPQDADEFLAELKIAIGQAEREPVSAGSLASVGSPTLVESTIALSHPADGEPTPAATVSSLPSKKASDVVLPPRRPQRSSTRPSVAPPVARRPRRLETPPKSGVSAILDRAFWQENSSKFLVFGVCLLVVLTFLAVILLPNRQDDSSVAGVRETQDDEQDLAGPQIIGLSTTEVTEDSITIEFSTDVCSVVSFAGEGLDTVSTQGWPDDFTDCSTQHSHTFTDLELGNVYTVMIEAASEGLGLSSETVEFTAGFAAIEGSPTVVGITKSTATIEFTTSTCTVVEYSGEGLERFAENGWPDANVGCSETHRHQFEGLDSATSYTIEVNILDREGRRTRVPVEFVTPNANFAISQFTVSSVSDAQATVSFVTSRCSHARFYGSAGSYFEEGWNNPNVECSNRHSYTYTALKPGTEYTVEVEARDASERGQTAKSTKALVFTTGGVSAVPRPTATIVSTSSEAVTLEVKSDVCMVVRVEIDSRVIDVGNWEAPSDSNCAKSHPVVINGLDANAEYSAVIRTKSVEGQQGTPIMLAIEPATGPTLADASSTVDDQQATVSFTATDCDTYSVELAPAGGSTPKAGQCQDGAPISVVFENLATGTYSATITVSSGASSDTATTTFEIRSIDG